MVLSPSSRYGAGAITASMTRWEALAKYIKDNKYFI